MKTFANATKGLDSQTTKVAVVTLAGVVAAQALKFAIFHALRRSAERNTIYLTDAQS